MEIDSGAPGSYKESDFERPGPDLFVAPGKPTSGACGNDLDMEDSGSMQRSTVLPRSRSDVVGSRLRSRPLSMAQFPSTTSLSTPERKRSRFRLLRKKRKSTDPGTGSDLPYDPETASMASNMSGMSTMSGVSTSESMYSLRTRKRRGLEALAEAVSRSPAVKAVKRSFSHSLNQDDVTGSPCKQPKIHIKEYVSPKALRTRPREQRLWTNTVNNVELLSKEVIRRQEAIHEIYVHSTTMRDDARTVLDNYLKPMKQLSLLTGEEESTLFGNLPAFPEIHDYLAEKLAMLRNPDDGTVDCVGNTLLYCFPKLRLLISFCVQLSKAKTLYDQKTAEKPVADFLERCQKSSFSSKRSLWDFLDSQRSSLVKYPLLLKGVIKTTPSDHPDMGGLSNALTCIDELIAEMDRRTGEFRCAETLKMLEYTYDTRCPIVDRSKALLCSGTLKLASRNQRVQVCLFDRGLVIGRPSTNSGTLAYQVSQAPVHTDQMTFEDLNDGDVSSLGSFRSALQRRSQPSTGLANAFRVSRAQQQGGDSTDSGHSKQRNSYTFVANDIHDKKVWLDSIQAAIEQSRSRPTSTISHSSTTSATSSSTRSFEIEMDDSGSQAMSTVV
eukprot:scpid40382/ scgid25974/ Neuroepithelial cell-transforming gene 1 protein; Proto-oncogene p65 Net1; Rho guanine nucleotide exchange factor 8